MFGKESTCEMAHYNTCNSDFSQIQCIHVSTTPPNSRWNTVLTLTGSAMTITALFNLFSLWAFVLSQCYLSSHQVYLMSVRDNLYIAMLLKCEKCVV